MKRVTSPSIIFLLILGLGCLRPQPLFAQQPIEEPVLESYTLTQGGNQGGAPSGVNAVISDRSFGGGTARASIVFTAKNNSSRLSLKVWRKVKPGEITFALLVFRIEIRGYAVLGRPIFTRDLNGFTFGDSSSGRWSQKVRDLPANINRIRITFIGNYE